MDMMVTVEKASKLFNATYAGKVPNVVRSSVRYEEKNKEGKLYIHFDTDNLQDLWHAFQKLPQVNWYGHRLHVVIPNPPTKATIEFNNKKFSKSS